MKIAIFGGAFNPPHAGHLNLVEQVNNQLNFDKILIIPTGNAPHKKTQTPFETRFKWTKEAFEHLNYCEISDIENTPQKSYTVDTLKKLRNIYHDAEFSLIIGSDMLEYFEKWHEYRELLQLCTVVAAARDGGDYRPLAKRLGVTWLDIPVVEMSSTEMKNPDPRVGVSG
ncbi:MAG: nicotinate (nicotinamide) nucleotide adenylyltransferase [Oscillospiraceae bacterium]|nr:nicotinate (nicotinamide) nucleotide adenylyltransferase [Oscillospiraceae bacterium]